MPGRRIRAFVALVFLAATLLALAVGHAQGQAFDLDADTRIMPPIQYKHLTVFPVVHKAAVAVDRAQYLTLNEGLQRRQVAVQELKGGGQVNRVNVANLSDKPLLLLGGEIILGGQQDRVLGKDTIIPAHTEVAVQVFCVEHGRWSGKRDFGQAGGLADGKVRMRAKYRNDQRQVWAEVSKKNAALGAQNSTDTYRRVAAGAEGQWAVKPYREHIARELQRLPEAKKLIGFIAAVNGRIVSVDVFASPTLFASYRERLLDSIILSAADVPVDKAAPAATAAQAKRFVDEAEAAPAKEVVRQRGSQTYEKRAKGVLNSTVRPAAPAAKPVYKSYQAAE
ncbi:MAG: hypothetical protein HY906_16920 [Deltaproteobacteria bacterium]|nr:hypothetical protein [Deltaproteobacteria bacterium]